MTLDLFNAFTVTVLREMKINYFTEGNEDRLISSEGNEDNCTLLREMRVN